MTNWFKSRAAIFTFAFLLRLGLCWSVLEATPLAKFWHASEPAAIAQSILEGRGFASPYDPTQPTAWIAPIYPAVVVAPVFWIFGPYSWNSTLILVGINCLWAALTALVIFSLGTKILGAYEGAAAAWIWAACLPSAVVPLLIWDTALSALVLASGVFLAFSLQSSEGYFRWACAGLFCGFACLVNPALISPAPFLCVWLWLRARKQGKDISRQVAIALVLAVGVLSPWLLRNNHAFGRPVFIRSNFSAELYFGNLGFESHPLGPSREYQQKGELAFVAEKQRMVGEYIRNNFVMFTDRSLNRAIAFWIVPRIAGLYWPCLSLLCFGGLALALMEWNPFAVPLLLVLAVYPVPYYISYVFEKYRHPIEPIMCVLASYPLLRAFEFAKKNVFPRGEHRQ